jgi:hypothetical protein
MRVGSDQRRLIGECAEGQGQMETMQKMRIEDDNIMAAARATA